MAGLTWKQRRFVLEYFKDPSSQANAAIKAGYAEACAASQASQLLALPKVIAEIEAHEADAAAVAGLTRARVIREIMDIAFAKPSNLVRIRVIPCPRCWPENMKEMLGEPNSACALCTGLGSRSVWLADTSKLSPADAKLFLSAKQTKDGIEVKTIDRTPYVAMLTKIVGVDITRSELSGPGGGPIQIEASDLNELNDNQLEVIARMGVSSGVSQLPAPLTLEGS